MSDIEKALPGEGDDGTGPSPEIYAVDKGLSGWRFSRRGFLAAAGAAATGATAATLSGCGNRSGEILVLDAEARADAWRNVYAHEKPVTAIAWSPDGTLLVSTSEDETLKLWSMPEGTLEKKVSHQVAPPLPSAPTAARWPLATSATLYASGSCPGLASWKR